MNQLSFDFSDELPIMKRMSLTALWRHITEAGKRDNIPSDWLFIVRANDEDTDITIILRQRARVERAQTDVIDTLPYSALETYSKWDYDTFARKVINRMERMLAT